MDPAAIAAAREKLKAKFASQGAHVKGQERRVKVSTLKPTVVDDKKLTATLKKIGVTAIANVEEVNIFKEDTNIIHFSNPKVQACISANTFVVSGSSENKKMEELLPGILQHMGPLDGDNLKQMTERLAKSAGGKSIPGMEQLLKAAGAATAEDDDDLPDLQSDF